MTFIYYSLELKYQKKRMILYLKKLNNNKFLDNYIINIFIYLYDTTRFYI